MKPVAVTRIPDRVTLVLDGQVLGEEARDAPSAARRRLDAVPVDSIFDLRFVSDSAELASYGLCPGAYAAVATTAAEARRLGLRHPPPPLCIRTTASRNAPRLAFPVGSEFQFAVGQRDMLDECDREAPPDVQWASSAPTIAVVDSLGRLRAVSPGTAEVIATAAGAEARFAVTVVPPVARLEITPGDTTLAIGDRVWFRAMAIGADGRPMPDVVVAVSARESRASYEAPGHRGQPGIVEVHDSTSRMTRRGPNELLVHARRDAMGYVVAAIAGLTDTVRVQVVAP